MITDDRVMSSSGVNPNPKLNFGEFIEKNNGILKN
jgi:hypothetical protein